MQKSFKKTIALILSIVMIMGVLPMGLSFAAESDYTYTVADDKATITKYTGSDEEVIVPGTLGGYTVVAIAEKAFRDNVAIKKIKFADSIETIGNLAFYKCQSLVEVNLGNGVKSLVGAVFSNCQTIDTVIIGKSLTNIGTGAFNGTTVNNVLYKGSETDWAAISIGESNNRFTSAKIVFNYCEHEIENVDKVDPECEKAGNIQYWTCTLCNKNYSDANATTEIDSIIIPATGHTPAAAVKEKEVPATCTGTGSYDSVVYCSVSTCNAEISRTLVTVDKLDHTPAVAVKENEVPATCTGTGSYDSVVYCSVSTCNAEISRTPVTVDSLGHTVVIDKAVASTCATAGLTEGSHCSVCNEVLVAQEPIKANGHSEVAIPAVDATCTATGLTEGKKCTVCGEITTEQIVVDFLGHVEETVPSVAPTCTETGLTAGKKCSRCNEILVAQTAVDSLGHTEVVVAAVTPTCTETGLTEGKKCSVCNAIIVSQEVVPMVAHTYGDAVITKTPTCTTKGESKKTCTVCEYVLVEEVATTKHDIVEAPSKEPTCTEAGFTGAKWCSVCNTYLGEKIEVSALGHGFVKVEDKSYPATCTEDGIESKKCTRCGETANTVLTKLGHDLNTFEGVAATCTTDGYKAYETCNRCDYNTYKTIPALGHTAGAVATCTTAQNCTICGKQIASALGHTEVVMNAVEPGCETTGKTEGKVCSACGTVLVEQTILSAIGHNYVKDVDESRAPTCVDAGLDVSKCANCGDVKNVPVNAIGHDTEAFEGKTATCIENGYKAYVKCKVCDYNTYEVIPALGHTAGAAATCTTSQICTVCEKVLIKAPGHDVQIIMGTPATCTSNGLTDGKYCARCSTELEAQYVIAMLGHSAQTIKGTPATCTVDGLKDGVYCAVCDTWIIEQEVITAPGHKKVKIPAIPQTCTEYGWTEGGGCENCDAIFDVPQRIDPYGSHDIITVYGYAATCTEKGLTDGKKCSRSNCDYVEVEQVEIPAGHTLVIIQPLAPTCTEAGYAFGQKCSACGVITLQPTELPATGHTEGPAATCTAPQTCVICDVVLAEKLAHTPGAAATCIAPQTCTVCDGVLVEALGHDLEFDMTVTKPATCYSDGYEKADCKNCDYSYGKKLPATGHNVQNWTVIQIPTCKVEGKAVGLCLNCRYNIEKVLPIVEHKDDDSNNKCDFCGKSMGGITLPDIGGDKEEDDGKCTCNCHAVGIKGLIFDFILFLQRLFGLNKTCKCGEAHY